MTGHVATLDAAFVFAVTGAALLWAPLALIVAAVYLIGVAVVTDRRSAPRVDG